MRNKSSSESGKSTSKSPRRDDRGRWLPGCSPNPSGRPKGESITRLLRSIGDDEIMIEDIPMSKRRAVAELIWSKALSGDRYFVAMLLDRIDFQSGQNGEQSEGLTAHDLLTKQIIIKRIVVTRPDNHTLN